MDETKSLTNNAQFTMEQITKEGLDFIPNTSATSVEPPSHLKSFRLKPIYNSFVKTLNSSDFKRFIVPDTILGTTDDLFSKLRYKIFEFGCKDGENNKRIYSYLSIMAKDFDKYSENASFKRDLDNVVTGFSTDLNAFVMYMKSCSKVNWFSGYLFAVLISLFIFFGEDDYTKKRFSVLFDIKDDTPVYKRINEKTGFHFLSENVNSNQYTRIIEKLERIFPNHKQQNACVKKDATVNSTPYSLYSDLSYLLATMTRLADLYFLVNDNEMNIVSPPSCCLQPHKFTFPIFYAILCFIYDHYLCKDNSLCKNFKIKFDESDMGFNEKEVLLIPIISMLFQLLAYNLKAIRYSKQSYEDVELASSEKETEKHHNINHFLNCFLNLLEQYYVKLIEYDGEYFQSIKQSIEYSYRELIKCLFFNDFYDEVINRIEICKNEEICKWIADSIETCHPDLLLYNINYNPNEDSKLLHKSIYSVTEDGNCIKSCFKSLKKNLLKIQSILSKKFKEGEERRIYVSRDKYVELLNTMQTWFMKIQAQYFDSTPDTISKIEMLGVFQPVGQSMSTYMFNYPIYPNTGIHTFLYPLNKDNPATVIYGLSEYIVPSKFISFNYSGVGYHGSGIFYCKGKKFEGFKEMYNPEKIFITYDSCRGYLEIAFITRNESNYEVIFYPITYFKIDNSRVYYPSISSNSYVDFSIFHYNNVIDEIYPSDSINAIHYDRSGHFYSSGGNDDSSENDIPLYDKECSEIGMEYIKEMCELINGNVYNVKNENNNDKEDEEDEDSKFQIYLGLFKVFDNFISQLCLYSFFPDISNYKLLDDTLLPLANHFDQIISGDSSEIDLNEVDTDYDYTIKGHYLFLYQKTYPLPKEKTRFFYVDLVQDEIYVENEKKRNIVYEENGIRSERKGGEIEFSGRADGNTWEFTLTKKLSKRERQIFSCHSVILPSGNRFIGKFENPRNNSSGYFIGIRTFGLDNLNVKSLDLLEVKMSTKLHYLIGKSTASYSCIHRMENVEDYGNIINEKFPTLFNNKVLFLAVMDKEKEKDDDVKKLYEEIDSKEDEEMLEVVQNMLAFIEDGKNEDLFLKYLPNQNKDDEEWKLYRIAIGLYYYHLTDYTLLDDKSVKEFCEKNILTAKNNRLNGPNIFLRFKDEIIRLNNSRVRNSIANIKLKTKKEEEESRRKYIDKSKTECDDAIKRIDENEKCKIENTKISFYDNLIKKTQNLFYFYPLIKSLPNKYNGQKIMVELLSFLFEESIECDNPNYFLEYIRYSISGIIHYCYSYRRFEKLLIGNNCPKYAGNLYMYLNWYKRFQDRTYYIPVKHVKNSTYLHDIIQDISEEDFFLSLIGEKENNFNQINEDDDRNSIEKEINFNLAPSFEKIIEESFYKMYQQLIDFLPNECYSSDSEQLLSSADISKYLAVIDSLYKKYTPNELKCLKENFVDQLKEKIQYIFSVEDGILKKSFSSLLYTLSKTICESDPENKEAIGISIIEKLLKELHNLYPNPDLEIDVRDTFNEIVTLDIYQDIYSPSVSVLAELSNTKLIDVKIYLPILIQAFLTCNHSKLPFIIVRFLNNWLPDIVDPKELEITIPKDLLKNFIDETEKKQIPSCNQIIQLFLTMSGFVYPVHFGNFIKYFLKTDTYILACRVTSLLRNLQKKSENWSKIINDEIKKVLIKVQEINKENIKPSNFGKSRKSLKDLFCQRDTLFYKFIGSLHVIGGNYEILTTGSRVEVLNDVINIPSSHGVVMSMYREYYSRKKKTLINDPNLDRSDGIPKESTIYQVIEYCDIKLDNGEMKMRVDSDTVTPIPLVNSQPYRISEDIIEVLIDILDVIYTLYDNFKIVKANTDFFFIVTFMIFGTNALSHLMSNKNTIRLIVNKKPTKSDDDVSDDSVAKNMIVKAIGLADGVISSTSSLYDLPSFYEAFKELCHFWNKNEMSYISRNIEPETYQSYRQLNDNQIDALRGLINLSIPVEKAMKYIIEIDRPNNEEIVSKLFEDEYNIEKKKVFSYIGVISGDGSIDRNKVIADVDKYLTFTVGIPSATCVGGGKYYYEVLINEAADGVYFGWADPAFCKSNVDENYALGADRHSYSWGGRNNETFISRNSKSRPTTYRLGKGYRIGCLLDLESSPNSMSYSINGDKPFVAFQGFTHYEYLYPIIALRSTIDKKAFIEIMMNEEDMKFIPRGYTPIVEGRKEFIRELFVKPYEEELEKYKTVDDIDSITVDNFNQSISTSSTLNRFYPPGNRVTDGVLTMKTINKITNKPPSRNSARYDYKLNLNTFTIHDSDSINKKNIVSTLYQLEIKCFILTVRVFLLEFMKYWIVYKPVDYNGDPIQCLKYFCNCDVSKASSGDIDGSEKEKIYSNVITFIKLCINFPLDVFASLPIDVDNDPNEIIAIPEICSKYKEIFSKNHSSYYETIYNTNINKNISNRVIYSEIIQALITYDLSINHDINNEICELLLRILRTECIRSSKFENKDNSRVLEIKNPFHLREDHISYNESNAVKECSMQLIEIITDEILNYYSNDYNVVYVIFKSWVITLQSPSFPLKSDSAAVLSSVLNHISYLCQNDKTMEKDKWIRIVESLPHLRLRSFINKEIYRSFSNYPMHAKDIQNIYNLVVSMNNTERLLLNNDENISHNSSWKDGFDLGVVSDEYLVQLSGFSGKSGVGTNTANYKEIEQGDYVVRGPDWKPRFYNQDGGEGSVGIVNSLIPILSSSQDKSYQVEVEWLNSPGLPMSYFWNKDGEYEIQIVEYDKANRKILKKLPLVGGGSEKSVSTGVRLIINNNLRDEGECKFDGIIEYPQYCGKIKVEGILGRIKANENGIERTIQFDETQFLAGKTSMGWETRFKTENWLPIRNYNGIIKINNNRITANIQYTIESTETACELSLSSEYLFQFMKEMNSTSQVFVNDNNDKISYCGSKAAYVYGSCGFTHGVKYFELKVLNSLDSQSIGIGITSEIPVVGKPIDSPYPQFIYYSNSQLSILREKENNNQPNANNRNRACAYGGLYRKGDVVGVNVNSSSDKLSFTYDGKKYEIPQIYEFSDATRDITVGSSYSSEWTLYPLVIFSDKNFNNVSNNEVKIHKWLSVDEYPSDTLLFYGELFDYLSPCFITDDINKSIKIPEKAISYIYRYCKRWLSNKYRRYETRTKGVYVDLNIDKRAMEKLQLNRKSEDILTAGSIAIIDNREIEILGCYRQKIWYRLTSADQQDGYSRISRSAWYLNEDELDSVHLKKRSRLLDLTSDCYFDSTPFEVSESDFSKEINSEKNTKKYYMDIIKMINRLCENKGVTPPNVCYKYVEDFYKKKYDNQCDNGTLIRCFSVVSVLMMVNIIIQHVLSYTVIDQTLSYNDTAFGNKDGKEKWTDYSQTNYIHRMKEYMFSLTKKEYLDKIITATETMVYYQVDDIAESYLIKKIKINRFTNVKGVESIFHQIVKYFFNEKIPDITFRINYQGAKQGGQYRMFRVELEDEGVIDSGGAYRVIYEQMIEELKERSVDLPFIFDIESSNNKYKKDEYPLLIKYEDKYLINFNISEEPFYRDIYFFGVLIGSALRCRMELNIPFIPMIWKYLIGRGIDQEEIKEIIDRFVYFKLQRDSEEKIDNEDEETIRKDAYEKIQCAIKQFCKGFYMCIPQEAISVLNEEEIERTICGVGKLNLEELQKHSIYEGYNENDRVVKDFWHVLREFTDEEKRSFMNFAWAKTRLSSNGIDFDFLIRKRTVGAEENPDDYLPSSHTCFYSMDIPFYSTKEILKNKLKYAMEEAFTLDGDFADPNGETYARMD